MAKYLPCADAHMHQRALAMSLLTVTGKLASKDAANPSEFPQIGGGLDWLFLIRWTKRRAFSNDDQAATFDGMIEYFYHCCAGQSVPGLEFSAKQWKPGQKEESVPLPRELIEGHKRYLRNIHGPELGRRRQLADLGQTPTALVIACCDARVDVSNIFDAGPGELFIIRNIANLVPPYEPEGIYHGTSAAIEFAVLGLKVPHIIVLGHSHCGGIAAFRKMQAEESCGHSHDDHGSPSFLGHGDSFITRWMSLLNGISMREEDAVAHGPEVALELAGVRASLDKLRTFPALAERERQSLVSLHGVHFDIADGRLLGLHPKTDRFVTVGEEEMVA